MSNLHSAVYWRNRAAHLMYDRMEQAEVVSSEISELYRTAYNQVAHDMSGIFVTYEKAYGLSDKEAMNLLNTLTDPSDIKALKKALQKAATPEAIELLKRLDSPAYMARIARLQELQKRIEVINHDLYRNDLKAQRRWYTSIGSDSYYHGIYDVQKQVGFQFSFAHVDDKLIRDVMNSSWLGANFSERLWSNVDGVTREVRKQLTWGLITGKSERRMADEIANKYAVGSFESRRLVRTESCHLSNEMQFKAYEECGADRYQYVATLDSRTDEECGALDRQVFYVKDKRVGVNCPPMHPFCRCTTKIYIDKKERNDLKRRARNPKTGKNEIISADVSYNEWAKMNGIKPKK